MNKDEIIKMAREAGIPIEIDWAGRPSTLVVKDGGTYLRGVDDLERFFHAAYAAGAKAEQDRCCKIVYGMAGSDNVAQRTVDAIRRKE